MIYTLILIMGASLAGPGIAQAGHYSTKQACAKAGNELKKAAMKEVWAQYYCVETDKKD